jgi:hypothetical protein
MLLRLFKGTGPGVLLLIIVVLLALWISAFFNPLMGSMSDFERDPMPLYGLLKLVVGNNPVAGVVFSFLMVSLMAFLLVNFNTTAVFISERTFLPALIYILAGGLFPQYQLLNPVLPSSLFLMLAIIKIVDGYHKQGIAYNFFDAGILISTGSLFYANLIWFGILVIIGIALLRSGSIMEIALSIIGLMTPYLIAFGFYYITGNGIKSLFYLIKDNLFGKSADYQFSTLTLVTLIIISLIIIISVSYLAMLMNTRKIKSRKTFSLLLWVFFISLGICIIVPSVSVEIVWLISIPVSYFLTHYFVFAKKKLVPEILFSVLFILILLLKILYLK